MKRSRAAALLCSALVSPSLAWAQPVGPDTAPAALSAPPAAAAADEEEDPPPPLPPAKDTLRGHWLLSAAALADLPFGKLDSRTSFSDAAGGGLGGAAELGFGISRSVSIGAWFQYVSYGEASDCVCDSTSVAFGPYIRYHLVQGTRFDPWIALGAGFRRVESHDDTADTTRSGIDWLRLQIGGDWYALSQLGFGPYLELDVGTFGERPANSSQRLHADAIVGVRIALDFMGK